MMEKLETENLLLREIDEYDADKIFELRSDKENGKYLDRPICKSREEAVEFIKKIQEGSLKEDVFYWAVCLKETREFTGTICLWNISYDEMTADIGFELLPGYQGKGIMLEAADKVIGFGFNKLNLKAINGEVDTDNLKSIRLMEKKGFKLLSQTAASDKTKVAIYQLRKSYFT